MEAIEKLNNLMNSSEIVALLNKMSSTLENTEDLDPLIDYVVDAKYVLLVEASHGTHEYYTWRAKITQRLIQEKGFSFVGVVEDWTDCYHLNRYVQGHLDSGKDIFSVMNEF